MNSGSDLFWKNLLMVERWFVMHPLGISIMGVTSGNNYIIDCFVEHGKTSNYLNDLEQDTFHTYFLLLYTMIPSSDMNNI